MEDISTEKAKRMIAKYTGNLILSIFVGMALTILLGSSSAVIILAIVFINAGTMRFRQAIGIIMGANIGTTFSSQLIALDVGKYAVIPLIIGLCIDFFAKRETIKKYGNALFYFGMLFFGLFIMEQSVLPLRDSALFEKWITRIDQNLIQGTLIGGLITLIVQSSSATVGMAIVLGKQNLISLAGGLAIMLGSELGTCSDTLIATIKGTRQSLKAGLFHLLFNFITIVTGLLVFDYFLQFVLLVSQGQPLNNQIANAHMIFNLVGVLAFLPFVNLTEKLLDYLLPEKLTKA
ncbi:Na+/Pi-cotransporter family protein [Croceitalea dokdonensis DOKDO 023]|uniref:Na+/Pi-cotransporter family protein n=2 Tax=Croceitalea TaxID=574891 RepID=A0A0P7AZ87_9FLAO|nr:Na+/Pi-cotransporter family protein [Croceitalea dokdonensis DOKDO 023]